MNSCRSLGRIDADMDGQQAEMLDAEAAQIHERIHPQMQRMAYCKRRAELLRERVRCVLKR